MNLTSHINTERPSQTKVSGVFTVNSEPVFNSTELTVCNSKNITKVMLTPVIAVKVHKELLTNICQTREENNIYFTNKVLKIAAFYYVLKALTPSGVIQNYTSQYQELKKLFNISHPTLTSYIKQAEKRGYLKRKAGNIILSSYSHFCGTFDAVYTEMVTINFAPGKHHFYALMQSAYLQVKEQTRAKTFESKIKSIRELTDELQTILNPDKNGNYQRALAAAQFEAFKYGSSKLSLIFSLNPDTSVNSHTLRVMFGFKSQQSVAYLKASLKKRGLIKITERKIYTDKSHRLKHLTIKYDAQKKQKFWHMPDRLEYAPILAVKKIEK